MKKAFTLIELLVVVAIIAILTSIVLAQFSVAKSKSRDTKRVADVAQIQLAIQLYFDRCNQYPSSITLASSGAGCPPGITFGTFLNKVPTPPSGDYGDASYDTYQYYVHATSGINDNYYLMSKLENASPSIFDSSISGTIPVGGTSGWTELTSQEVGKNTLYYTVGPK